MNSFYFKKNWVPMFFPVWIGLTVFTFGVYGIAAGPMNTTKVDFGFTARLRNARTGRLVAAIPETFQSTDVMTVYSDSNDNPYGNPGLVFGSTLNNAMRRLGAAIAQDAGGTAP